jgi:hypothetical protein
MQQRGGVNADGLCCVGKGSSIADDARVDPEASGFSYRMDGYFWSDSGRASHGYGDGLGLS